MLPWRIAPATLAEAMEGKGPLFAVPPGKRVGGQDSQQHSLNAAELGFKVWLDTQGAGSVVRRSTIILPVAAFLRQFVFDCGPPVAFDRQILLAFSAFTDAKGVERLPRRADMSRLMLFTGLVTSEPEKREMIRGAHACCDAVVEGGHDVTGLNGGKLSGYRAFGDKPTPFCFR